MPALESNVRRFDLEQADLSRLGIKDEIDTWEEFVRRDEGKLSRLCETGSYPNMRGYERIAEIRRVKAELMRDQAKVEVLRVGLESNLPVTLAMLGIQVWAPKDSNLSLESGSRWRVD